MSEEIFFQNDNEDEFIEGWLKESDAVNDGEEDVGKASLVRLGNDARNKFGLGFETKGAVDSATKKEHDDALMKRIKKRKLAAKEERKRGNQYEEQHGLVEDEIESRAAIVSRSSKQQKLQSTSTNNNSNTGQAKGNKTLVEQSDNSLNVKSNKNAGKVGRNNEAENSNNLEKSELEKRKRKRPKTRSKQKNIRRDKRDAEYLPEHLRVGSKSYKGRPLTEETKKHLGIKL